MMDDVFIHESSYVERGAVVGAGTKIWHFCHVQSGAVIGAGCTLGQNVNVAGGAVIGDGVKLQNNVSVYNGVVLEDHVFCGPSMVFTNDLTPRARWPKGDARRVRTVVRHDATIGANATVVCGHELGAWCMVAAGAVVTADVPPHALVAGVPARQVGWVCECGQVLNGSLCCPDCAKRYVVEKNELKICPRGGVIQYNDITAACREGRAA